jgi:ribosome maturation factor RimP
MIDKNVVRELVEEWLQGKEYFLVDVTVSADDRIVVEIDHAEGVWIDDCVQLSKFIEEHLNRDEQDYELEVGSAGIGQPFKVLQQYVCHIGKPVEVLTLKGEKKQGILKEVNEEQLVITAKTKVKAENAKRPKMVDVDYTYPLSELKYTKYLISFK